MRKAVDIDKIIADKLAEGTWSALELAKATNIEIDVVVSSLVGLAQTGQIEMIKTSDPKELIVQLSEKARLRENEEIMAILRQSS